MELELRICLGRYRGPQETRIAVRMVINGMMVTLGAGYDRTASYGNDVELWKYQNVDHPTICL